MKKFCCCFRLKTGCFIIAAIGWIFVFVLLYDACQDFSRFKCGRAIGSAVASTLLFLGTAHADRKYIRLWLIFKGAEIVLLIFGALLLISNLLHEPRLMVTFAVVLVIVIAIQNYFWICVWSYYKEIEELNQPIPSSDPTALHDSPAYPSEDV